MIKKLLLIFLLASFFYAVGGPESGAGGLPPILSPSPEETKESEALEEAEIPEETTHPEPEEVEPGEAYEIDIEEFLIPEQVHEEDPRETSRAWIPIAFIGAFAAALILLRVYKRGT